MPTITTAQPGNWSSGSTWVGGSVPVDGDTAVVDHDLTFNADQSSWTTGLMGNNLIKEGVTLTVSNSVSSHMRMGTNGRWCAKQAATRANPARFRCGTSLANGLPASVNFTLYSFSNVSRNAIFTSDILRATFGVLDVVCVDAFPRPIRFATCAAATSTTALVVRLHSANNTPMSLSVGETIFIANGTARTSFIERTVTAIANNNNGTMTLTLNTAPGFTIAKGALIAATTSNVVIEFDTKTGTSERSVFGGLVNAPLRCLIRGADIAVDSGFVNQGGHSSGVTFEGWIQQSRIAFRAGSGYLVRNGGGHADSNGFNGIAKQCNIESAGFCGGGTFAPATNVYGQTRIIDNSLGQPTFFSFIPYIFRSQTLHESNGSVVIHNAIEFVQNDKRTANTQPPPPSQRFKSMHWIESFLTAGFGFASAIDSTGAYNAYRGEITTERLILDYASGTPFIGPNLIASTLWFGDAGERGFSRFQAANVQRIAGPIVSGDWLVQSRFGTITPNANPAFGSASRVVFGAASSYANDGYIVLMRSVFLQPGFTVRASARVKMDNVFTTQPWRLVIFDPQVTNPLDSNDAFHPSGSMVSVLGSATAASNTSEQLLAATATATTAGEHYVALVAASDDGHVGWAGALSIEYDLGRTLVAAMRADADYGTTGLLQDAQAAAEISIDPSEIVDALRADADYGTSGLLADADAAKTSAAAAASAANAANNKLSQRGVV